MTCAILGVCEATEGGVAVAVTCTVGVSVVRNARCDEPAVYVDKATGFAECEKHAADPGSLASAGDKRSGGYRVGYAVGDSVPVRRYGLTYEGSVVEVGKRGAVYAEFTYKNGAKRKVRV